ncbi:MAG: hypothetical protein WCX69_02225 [Candidatus Paceibacterota bacterium]
MTTPPKKQTGSLLENSVFYLSLLLLALMVGAFFYSRYLVDQSNAELAELSLQASKTKTEEQKKLEDRVLMTQQKLSDFSKKLENRQSSAVFFGNLETLILPEIYFSLLDLDLQKSTADITGRADTLQALGQQISMFRSASNLLERVDLTKVTIVEGGGVDFQARIGLGPEMAAFK